MGSQYPAFTVIPPDHTMSASPAKTALVEMSPSKKQARIEKAQELLTSGKRNLLVSYYSSAVSDFADLAKKSEENKEEHGDLQMAWEVLELAKNAFMSISEVLYQLGKYKEAEASLGNAIKVLQKRIENLKKMGESENIAKEIKNIETMIDEIKEKIEDHKNMEKGIHVEKESSVFPGKSDGQAVSSISIKSAKPAGTATVGTA